MLPPAASHYLQIVCVIHLCLATLCTAATTPAVTASKQYHICSRVPQLCSRAGVALLEHRLALQDCWCAGTSMQCTLSSCRHSQCCLATICVT